MKTFNASQIRDTILPNKIGYYEKEGYVFGVSSFVDGVSIAFYKNGDIKFLFQAYDLDSSKTKDKRPEFIRISSYEEKELIEFNLLVDFDEAHIPSKNIHLNYDYKSKENLKNASFEFLKQLDHFEVICKVNEAEKTIIVNFEATLISFLDFLKDKDFYSNFDKVYITKIHPSSDDFLDKVEIKLKELYK